MTPNANVRITVYSDTDLSVQLIPGKRSFLMLAFGSDIGVYLPDFDTPCAAWARQLAAALVTAADDLDAHVMRQAEAKTEESTPCPVDGALGTAPVPR